MIPKYKQYLLFYFRLIHKIYFTNLAFLMNLPLFQRIQAFERLEQDQCYSLTLQNQDLSNKKWQILQNQEIFFSQILSNRFNQRDKKSGSCQNAPASTNLSTLKKKEQQPHKFSFNFENQSRQSIENIKISSKKGNLAQKDISSENILTEGQYSFLKHSYDCQVQKFDSLDIESQHQDDVNFFPQETQNQFGQKTLEQLQRIQIYIKMVNLTIVQENQEIEEEASNSISFIQFCSVSTLQSSRNLMNDDQNHHSTLKKTNQLDLFNVLSLQKEKSAVIKKLKDIISCKCKKGACDTDSCNCHRRFRGCNGKCFCSKWSDCKNKDRNDHQKDKKKRKNQKRFCLCQKGKCSGKRCYCKKNNKKCSIQCNCYECQNCEEDHQQQNVVQHESLLQTFYLDQEHNSSDSLKPMVFQEFIFQILEQQRQK